MHPLASGTVTFLFTDVEQSTRLWEQFPDQMRLALARHDVLGETCITQHGGTLVKERGEGDSLFATFPQAVDALAAAITFQKALLAEAWPSETPLQVRMALHTGDVEMRDGDYYGTTVNRCGRIRATAHGAQILISQAIAEILRDALPPDVTLRDLGLHRLKDLQRPERLAQVLHPALPSDFPPLRSLDVVKHNLPRQLTSFIGRDKEIQKVRALLDKTCLLTLTGSGGSGKTRLALQVAAELADAYPDGVWLAELAPLPEKATPDVIAKAIAAVLHIKEQVGQDTLVTLSEALTAKSLLLLLDNCEHVEQSCRSVVHALLIACPDLRILATSRHHLSVPGEALYPVISLSLPPKDAVLTPASALEYESLRLFVERAQAASPRFALTASNLPHVAQICRRLDGIPLAIELAAARVSALRVDKVAEHLDDAFRFLKAPGVVERHQTLLKTIEWSYALLNDAEKALLRRLSVFVGGWTLEACEAVCAWGDVDHWDVVDLLTRLVQTSLVTMQDDRQDDRESPAQGNGASEEAEEHPCRYYLLETLRQFGQEKLEEFGETEQARKCHLEYFLNLAEQAEPELTGPHQAQWLERLETDHDNLRAALKWATDGETRLRLACALWRFWSTHSYFSEGRSWLSGALARGREQSPSLRAKASNGLGYLATRQSDYQEAHSLLSESLRLRREANDQAGMAETLNNLANVASAQGEQEEARNLFEQSLHLWQQVGDQRGIAAALNNIGILLASAAEYVQAKSHFERGLEIYRRHNDAANMAATMGNLGAICSYLQEYDRAKHYYEETLTLHTQLGNRWGAAAMLYNLGEVTNRQKDFTAAAGFLLASLALWVELGDRSGCADAMDTYAEVMHSLGKSQQTIVLCSAAQNIRKRIDIMADADTEQQVLDALDQARTTMEEAFYATLWSYGAALSAEQALLYIKSH